MKRYRIAVTYGPAFLGYHPQQVRRTDGRHRHGRIYPTRRWAERRATALRQAHKYTSFHLEPVR